MSKAQALIWAVLCGVIAICLAVIGLYVLIGPTIIWGVICLAIFSYKAVRDAHLVANSKQQIEPAEQLIQMTSPGSHRLFVPDPLDRSR